MVHAVSGSAIGPEGPTALSVMTWNVRRPVPTLRADSPDRWENRRDILRTVLQQTRPSVLGVQEALPEQLEWIAESAGYQWIGRGRDSDGGGEHCAVFYDPARIRVGRWAQYALSRTPSVPGSRSWGAAWPRIAVVAELIDVASGGAFRLINTHLDHMSPVARRHSAVLLRAVVRGRFGVWRDPLPTVLMGDANADRRSAPYRILTAELTDTWLTAKRRASPAWRSYSGYARPRLGRRIDWILASPDIAVDAAAVAAVRIGDRAGSDHEPVQAVLRLPGGELRR
ncbi:MAG: endonuclease/exonuclease/phosphatase family protein [Naasia sp.]|nr:endonuclease/exonuclease/phosphatase family protein [Naasia sp.]